MGVPVRVAVTRADVPQLDVCPGVKERLDASLTQEGRGHRESHPVGGGGANEHRLIGRRGAERILRERGQRDDFDPGPSRCHQRGALAHGIADHGAEALVEGEVLRRGAWGRGGGRFFVRGALKGADGVRDGRWDVVE
jgi:hypothetical protein